MAVMFGTVLGDWDGTEAVFIVGPAELVAAFNPVGTLMEDETVSWGTIFLALLCFGVLCPACFALYLDFRFRAAAIASGLPGWSDSSLIGDFVSLFADLGVC